jgi:hypothetical protein
MKMRRFKYRKKYPCRLNDGYFVVCQRGQGGQTMKKYKITYYADGVKHSQIIEARNKDDALKIAWSLVDADSVYISEVDE